MDFTRSDKADLLVPTAPPPKPDRQHWHPMEIAEPASRDLAKAALLMLWDAMELTRGAGMFNTPESMRRVAHRRAYDFIGELLLGDERPEREVLT